MTQKPAENDTTPRAGDSVSEWDEGSREWLKTRKTSELIAWLSGAWEGSRWTGTRCPERPVVLTACVAAEIDRRLPTP